MKTYALRVCFRRDSDIFNFYGYASRLLTEQSQYAGSSNIEQYIDSLIAKKSKLAIWIVSNCNRTAGARLRMNYVEQLVRAGLDLDRRGKCFPQNGYVDKEEIVNYKFYLSFENSWHCKDYITEKVFKNAFKIGGAVPIVFGAKKSDYEALVPPGSCIYAEDFKSPKSLVDYLNYLDKNETAYRSYMKWRTMKKDEMPMSEIAVGFCQLCRVLHGINIDNIYSRKFSQLQSYIPLFGYPNKSRVVPSLKDWFFDQDYSECIPSS